ncbi:SGNH/GDSL hydrolase family protein [Sphingomonas faeni]|uniref:SGNH/GDSL hydrolase family protein n=1 Tax=Sphingomonas faeni TaxID=185950 RepID=UPI0020C82B24|nr:SGNH/GDSL hydrolase family protein [Sphingomonas faeni]MCP8892997.1 SGNH/GDSL hydrolase family protein [Sphingomonas faeni]
MAFDPDAQELAGAALGAGLAAARATTAGRGASASFQSNAAREGFQATNTRITYANTSAAVAVGTVLGAIGPGLGQALYVTSLALTSDIEVLVHMQRGNANLIANAASPGIAPLKVGPGRATIVEIFEYVREKESISFVLRTAVATGAGTNTFNFEAGFHSQRFTNDFAFEAPKVMLVIGDSLSNTTILGTPVYGYDFWHAAFQRWLRSIGKHYRRVVKGDGGWKTSHAVIALKCGQFDILQADAIMVMLGTNETVLADFESTETGLPALVAGLREMYPTQPLILMGPPPRLDAIEASVMQPLRAWEATYADGLSNTLYVSFADAFAANITNLPDNVHTIASGQAGMFAKLRDSVTATAGLLARL